MKFMSRVTLVVTHYIYYSLIRDFSDVVPEKSYVCHWKMYDVFFLSVNFVFDPSSMILVDAALARA